VPLSPVSAGGPPLGGRRPRASAAALLCLASVVTASEPALGQDRAQDGATVFAGIAVREAGADALAERAAVALAQAMEKRGVVDVGTPPLPVVSEVDDPVLDNAVSAAIARYQEADFARAPERADEAIARFEKKNAFVAGGPWEQYGRALLVKSLAERKLGREDAADATLRTLAVTQPKRPPDPSLATPSLLERYTVILDEMRGKARVQIEVTSSPAGAAVVLDGEARGTTPVVVRELLPGTHFVAIEREGVLVQKAVDASGNVRLDERLGDPRADAAKALRAEVASGAKEEALLERARAIGDDVVFGVLVLDATGRASVALARVRGGELMLAGTHIEDKSALKARLAPVADALLDGVASHEGMFIPEAPGSPRTLLFDAQKAAPPAVTDEDEGLSPLVVVAGVGVGVLVVGAAAVIGTVLALQAGEEVRVVIDASQL
jgi:PEGA domain